MDLETLSATLAGLPDSPIACQLRAAIDDELTAREHQAAQDRQREQARIAAERAKRRKELTADLASLDAEYVSAHKKALMFLCEWQEHFHLTQDEQVFLENPNASASDVGAIRTSLRYSPSFPATCADRISQLRAKMAKTRRALAALD